jgi:hypothetical protein
MRHVVAPFVFILMLIGGCGGAEAEGEDEATTELAAPVLYDADAVGACVGFETGTVRDFERRDHGAARAAVTDGWGGFYDETTRISFFAMPSAAAAADFRAKWDEELGDEAEVRGNAVLAGYARLDGEERHLIDSCLSAQP